jgi:Uma2 family endonuclease
MSVKWDLIEMPGRSRPLTPDEAADLFFALLEDDTEESPWMTMGDLQFWSASGFAYSLRLWGRERGLGWYVGAMLPVLFRWKGRGRRHSLSPDVLVALAPDRPRSSFDSEQEGGFPAFVLEVVSPSSVERDHDEKLHAYDLLKAREYAIFTPRLGEPSTLEGYRREGADFVPWPRDERGGLWSEVLELHLEIQGRELRARTPDGRLLPSPAESWAALQAAEEAQQAAEAARRAAEAENERLRRELERLRGGPAGG